MKIDLHLHTNKDKMDRIKYSPYELIDFMAKRNYGVLAITHHNQIYFNENLKRYAEKKKILLISGIEFRINSHDILAYNITEEDVKKVKKLRDVKKIKRKNTLIIAAHPYYPIYGLKEELEKNIDLFDAIEYCHWYTKYNNKGNERAVEVAKRYNLPLVANSDCHRFMQVGTNYTILNCEKNVDAVIKAIKENKIKIYTKPLLIRKYINIWFYIIISVLIKHLKKIVSNP